MLYIPVCVSILHGQVFIEHKLKFISIYLIFIAECDSCMIYNSIFKVNMYLIIKCLKHYKPFIYR